MSPDWHQSMIWTNDDLLCIRPNVREQILIKIQTFHWRKYIWKCWLQNFGHFASASMYEGLVNWLLLNTDHAEPDFHSVSTFSVHVLLVEDCSISSAKGIELPQSFAKPSIYWWHFWHFTSKGAHFTFTQVFTFFFYFTVIFSQITENFLHITWQIYVPLSSSYAADGIFWLWGSIPRLLMPWLL